MNKHLARTIPLHLLTFLLLMAPYAHAQDADGGPDGSESSGYDDGEQDSSEDNTYGSTPDSYIDGEGLGVHLPSTSSADGATGPQSSDKILKYTRGPEGALAAVRDKKALPLKNITRAAHKFTNGNIIDAKLIYSDGLLQYELRVLEDSSVVRRFSFDARTGQLAKVR